MRITVNDWISFIFGTTIAAIAISILAILKPGGHLTLAYVSIVVSSALWNLFLAPACPHIHKEFQVKVDPKDFKVTKNEDGWLVEHTVCPWTNLYREEGQEPRVMREQFSLITLPSGVTVIAKMNSLDSTSWKKSYRTSSITSVLKQFAEDLEDSYAQDAFTAVWAAVSDEMQMQWFNIPRFDRITEYEQNMRAFLSTVIERFDAILDEDEDVTDTLLAEVSAEIDKFIAAPGTGTRRKRPEK